VVLFVKLAPKYECPTKRFGAVVRTADRIWEVPGLILHSAADDLERFHEFPHSLQKNTRIRATFRPQGTSRAKSVELVRLKRTKKHVKHSTLDPAGFESETFFPKGQVQFSECLKSEKVKVIPVLN
jgi:hypothetical protein